RRIVTAAVLLACLAVGARFAGAADSSRFLVSYGGTAGYQLPLWVNRELGFSKKYGVDLETILIQAGSPNIQALLGGSLQLTQTAASSAVIGANQGAPIVIVATIENKLPMLLISRPEIKEPQQLRGKVIGINRFGGSTDAAVLMALKAWKWIPRIFPCCRPAAPRRAWRRCSAKKSMPRCSPIRRFTRQKNSA